MIVYDNDFLESINSTGAVRLLVGMTQYSKVQYCILSMVIDHRGIDHYVFAIVINWKLKIIVHECPGKQKYGIGQDKLINCTVTWRSALVEQSFKFYDLL